MDLNGLFSIRPSEKNLRWPLKLYLNLISLLVKQNRLNKTMLRYFFFIAIGKMLSQIQNQKCHNTKIITNFPITIFFKVVVLKHLTLFYCARCFITRVSFLFYSKNHYFKNIFLIFKNLFDANHAVCTNKVVSIVTFMSVP